ncbi:MAG TPA: hypothetical protein VE869_07505 [Gemmatimonas sp.]|nr:hypothetical protein [Gemmatimonas sp.]
MTSVQTETVGSWFASLDPRPPAALATRIEGLLSPFASEPGDRVPDVCLEVGERLLNELLVSGCTSRGTAVDLLAVDALVSYAFEAAAQSPGTLEQRAARAMARISALPEGRPD